MDFTGEFWLLYVAYTILLVVVALIFYVKVKRNVFLCTMMQCVTAIFIALILIICSVW